MSILTVAGIILATTNQGGMLDGHAAKLSAAKGLSVTFTVEHIPAAPETYKLAYAKPDKFRLEYPGGILISDGKTVVEYTTSSNEYTESEAGKDALSNISDPDVAAWAAFFVPNQLKNVKDAKVVRKLSMKGNAVTQVDFTMDAGKSQTATFYIDDKLGIARGAAIKASRGGMSTETVVKASDLTIGDVDTALFTFTPPAGAKKVEMAAGDLSKWYHDLEEAKKVAKSTNRMLFVDFNATWCGPCQMYKHEVFPTAEFKAYGKFFVFVDIDTDEQPGLAKQFGANAIPDLHFLKSDGTEVHRVIGYKGMALLQDMEQAKGMK